MSTIKDDFFKQRKELFGYIDIQQNSLEKAFKTLVLFDRVLDRIRYLAGRKSPLRQSLKDTIRELLDE